MASGTEIAKAYVQIIPSAQGISGKLQEVLDPEAQKSGESAGNTIGQQIGSFVTKTLAAIGIGKMISDSITNGMDFETSMAKASTLFSGTDEELQKLQSDIVDISSRTGVAASQLAEAAYSAESASVPMGNLGGMIESSAKLATAGFTDIDTALSATAKTMNAYGMMSDDVAETQRQMEEVQRILIQTQNKGITTVGELGASLANVTPTAAAAGVGFDQVGAALALMTAQGTPTAQATTQLRSAIAELEKSGTKAATALGEASKGTEYAGQSFTQMMANGADLGDVMGMLQSYADKTGVSMLDLWGSIEGGNAAMAIAKDVSLFDEDLASMATSADVVGEAYSTMADTTSFKLDQLKNTLTNIGINAFAEFADPLQNALTGVSTVLTNIQPQLDTLGTAFSTVVTAVADFVANLLGFDEGMSASEVATSALQTVLTAAADALTFLADNMNIIAPIVLGLVTAFTAFKAVAGVQGLLAVIPPLSTVFTTLFGILAANPIGIVIAAVAALAAGVMALWNTNEGFRTAVTSFLSEVQTKVATAIAGIKIKLTEAKTAVQQVMTAIQTAVKEKITAALTWGKDLVANIAQGIRDKISDVKDAIGSVAGAIADRLHFSEPDVGPLSNFHTYMPDMIDMITSGIEAGIPRVSTAVNRMASTMVPSVPVQNQGMTSYESIPVNVNVVLQGDARQILKVVRVENAKRTRATGYNALAMN